MYKLFIYEVWGLYTCSRILKLLIGQGFSVFSHNNLDLNLPLYTIYPSLRYGVCPWKLRLLTGQGFFYFKPQWPLSDPHQMQSLPFSIYFLSIHKEWGIYVKESLSWCLNIEIGRHPDSRPAAHPPVRHTWSHSTSMFQ